MRPRRSSFQTRPRCLAGVGPSTSTAPRPGQGGSPLHRREPVLAVVGAGEGAAATQLYIDCDGFFAACEEQADRQLEGQPLGVISFAGAVQSCVIAARPNSSVSV